MGNFRRSRSILSRGPRRKTSWEVGPETGANGSPQQISSSAAILATIAAAAAEEITLVRTRGECVLSLVTSSQQSGGFHGAFAIGKATLAAFTAGAASVPTPLTEEAWDGWLYHRYFSCLSGGIINQGVSADEDIINSTSSAVRIEIDSKAMRKISLDEVFYAALEVVEIGTAKLDWSLNTRQLVKDQ